MVSFVKLARAVVQDLEMFLMLGWSVGDSCNSILNPVDSSVLELMSVTKYRKKSKVTSKELHKCYNLYCSTRNHLSINQPVLLVRELSTFRSSPAVERSMCGLPSFIIISHSFAERKLSNCRISGSSLSTVTLYAFRSSSRLSGTTEESFGKRANIRIMMRNGLDIVEGDQTMTDVKVDSVGSSSNRRSPTS